MIKKIQLSKNEMSKVVGGRTIRTKSKTSSATVRDKVDTDTGLGSWKYRYKKGCCGTVAVVGENSDDASQISSGTSFNI